MGTSSTRPAGAVDAARDRRHRRAAGRCAGAAASRPGRLRRHDRLRGHTTTPIRRRLFGHRDQRLQLSRESRVALKGGTLTSSAATPTANIIVQNYSTDLIIDMNVDATGSAPSRQTTQSPTTSARLPSRATAHHRQAGNAASTLVRHVADYDDGVQSRRGRGLHRHDHR